MLENDVIVIILTILLIVEGSIGMCLISTAFSVKK